MRHESRWHGTRVVGRVGGRHVEQVVGLTAINQDQCRLFVLDLAHKLRTLAPAHEAVGLHSALRRNRGIVRIVRIGISFRQIRRLARHHDRALQFALVRIEVRWFLNIESHNLSRDIAIGSLTPSEGAYADALPDRTDDFSRLASASPGVIDVGPVSYTHLTLPTKRIVY